VAVLDRVAGTATVLREWRGGMRMPLRPSEEVVNARDERVRAMVAEAAASVPHYRDLFRESGLDPREIVGADDLARLPLLDRATVAEDPSRLRSAALAEAMIEAGLLLGLSREISTQLVIQTMLGTAKQLRDEGLHPVELREMVTSPGGTTIAAIRELESAGVRAAFLNAIQAAMVRARELAAGSD